MKTSAWLIRKYLAHLMSRFTCQHCEWLFVRRRHWLLGWSLQSEGAIESSDAPGRTDRDAVVFSCGWQSVVGRSQTDGARRAVGAEFEPGPTILRISPHLIDHAGYESSGNQSAVREAAIWPNETASTQSGPQNQSTVAGEISSRP